MNSEAQADLAARVEPADMLLYVHNLLAGGRGAGVAQTRPRLAGAQLGGDTPAANAAQLRWSALNRAFGDSRVSSWTHPRRHDQMHVPAALIAAAGVARLTRSDNEIVFDIPTLLDATLELCEPAGHA
jgi:hypothetical protein